MNIVKLLNGRKTIIGDVLFMVTTGYVLLTGQTIEGLEMPESFGDWVTGSLVTLAAVFSAWGLGNKAIKKVKP
jgi:hypothetical protein